MWVSNILRNLFLMITGLVTLILMIVMSLNLFCGSNEPSPHLTRPRHLVVIV